MRHRDGRRAPVRYRRAGLLAEESFLKSGNPLRVGEDLPVPVRALDLYAIAGEDLWRMRWSHAFLGAVIRGVEERVKGAPGPRWPRRVWSKGYSLPQRVIAALVIVRRN